MLTFPQTRIEDFKKKKKVPGIRLGQAFHNFMRLEKCNSDKEFCDKLFELDGEEAMAAIMSRVDPNN